MYQKIKKITAILFEVDEIASWDWDNGIGNGKNSPSLVQHKEQVNKLMACNQL